MTVNVTLRGVKGTALSHAEVDGNFSSLKQEFDNLSAVNGTTSVGGVQAGHIANALKNTVTPENFGTGPTAIQQAINYCSSLGGGTVLLGPKTYTVTAPIELKRKVNLIGVDIEATVIHKPSASKVDDIDAVLIGRAAEQVNNFRLENFKVLGNRTSRAAGNIVTTNGIWLNFAHFYKISNVMVENCLTGFHLNQNFVAQLDRITGLMCQEYGFECVNSCTTLSVSNALAWGCRGGYRIHATIYSTFRDCACDHADAGGTLDDPFLPQGSGGYYLDPAYIWDIVASRVTITGGGTENSYSQWLYAEGAFVDFINPYVFNMKGYSNEYRAIQTRGVGKSKINIQNGRFDIALNGTPSAIRRMYFVENPRVQSISMDTVQAGTASFGDFAFPTKGVVFTEKDKILEYTQEKMVVGQTQSNMIYNAVDVEPVITLSDLTKRLYITNKTTAAQTMRVPVDNSGVIEIIAEGTHLSTVDDLRLRLVGNDGGTIEVVKVFNLSAAFEIRTYVFLNEQIQATGIPVFLEIVSPSNSDTTFFNRLEVSRVVC